MLGLAVDAETVAGDHGKPLSLNVGRGEVVALMGRNGAGKSTTLKSIAALVPRREGKILFRGEDIARKASHQIAQRGTAASLPS